MALAKEERETHIWFLEDLNITRVETSVRKHLTKLKKSGLTLVAELKTDGETTTWRFEGQGDIIRFPSTKKRKGRVMSEEEKAAASERMKKARGRSHVQAG